MVKVGGFRFTSDNHKLPPQADWGDGFGVGTEGNGMGCPYTNGNGRGARDRRRSVSADTRVSGDGDGSGYVATLSGNGRGASNSWFGTEGPEDLGYYISPPDSGDGYGSAPYDYERRTGDSE